MKRLEVKERLENLEPYLSSILDIYNAQLWEAAGELDTLVHNNLTEVLLDEYFEKGKLRYVGLRGQVCKE